MQASIGPRNAKLGGHLTTLMSMLDRIDDARPIIRMNHPFPTLISSVEATWRQPVQGLLLGRPFVDLLLDVPIESHRARGFLRKIQQILIILQTLQCLRSFGLRPFSVLDVECRHIPPNDTSLRVEQGPVAHQEPAILPIVAQNALLSAEWCATSQPSRARCANSLKILRVDDTIPIILLLYILHTEAGVIHHSLIYILDVSFGVQYINVCRNGVDDQTQIALVRLQSLFSLFEIVDVS